MIRQNTAIEQAAALHLSMMVDLLQAVRLHANTSHQWTEMLDSDTVRLYTRYVDDGHTWVITRTVSLMTMTACEPD